jgi:hypothetical protein
MCAWLKNQWEDVKGNAKWAVLLLVGGAIYHWLLPRFGSGILSAMLRISGGVVISGLLFGAGRLSTRKARLQARRQTANEGKAMNQLLAEFVSHPRRGKTPLGLSGSAQVRLADDGQSEIERKPNIYCFAATIIGVSPRENGGITEVPVVGRRYGESFNGVIAKFENEFSETALNVDAVSARLIFKNEDGEVAVRVEAGCWLEEDFNFTYFDVGTVQSLVLCGISVPELGRAARYRMEVPDDRRESANRYNFLGYNLKSDTYDVDVILNYGNRFRPTEYKFKLDIRDPVAPKIEILKAR